MKILEKYDFETSNIAEKLESTMVRPNDTGIVCVYSRNYYYCHHIQRYLLTEEGICYQFNGLDPVNWYREKKFFNENIYNFTYEFENTFDGEKPHLAVDAETQNVWNSDSVNISDIDSVYPKRTIWAGVKSGYINCVQVRKSDFDYLCKDGMQGHKIALVSPDEVPAIIDNFIYLPNDREIVLTVTPQYIFPSKNIEKYDPEIRQCYFDYERYLRFFKYYNQRNCELECLTNFTVAECGCTNFYMPSELF